MLTEQQINDYAKELEIQQRAAQAALEEAKRSVIQAEANLNAVIGARQAVAHLTALNNADTKEAEDETEDTTR